MDEQTNGVVLAEVGKRSFDRITALNRRSRNGNRERGRERDSDVKDPVGEDVISVVSVLIPFFLCPRAHGFLVPGASMLSACTLGGGRRMKRAQTRGHGREETVQDTVSGPGTRNPRPRSCCKPFVPGSFRVILELGFRHFSCVVPRRGPGAGGMHMMRDVGERKGERPLVGVDGTWSCGFCEGRGRVG